MDKNNIKEKGRSVFIREKAQALREKPQTIREKPVSKAVSHAMRYRTIQTAKRRLREAEDSIAPAQEDGREVTPVDRAEALATGAAREAVRLTASAKNVFQRETHSGEASTQPPTPKELMREKAVRDFRERQSRDRTAAVSPEPGSEPRPVPAPEILSQREAEPVRPAANARPPVREKAQTVALKTRESVQAAQARKQTQRQTRTAKALMGRRQRALPLSRSSVKEQGRRLAQERAAQTVRQTGRAGGRIVRRLGAAIGKTAWAAGSSAILAGGGFVLLLVPLLLLVGAAAVLFSGGARSGAYTPVSAEVDAYTPIIQLYAREHGIPEYVELIKAVMMQESAGRGNDPMQASACGYNTRYPGGITDPEYSIDVGIRQLASCLQMAGVDSPIDLDNISLALQGYNYGSGYISWALANYGGYSSVNAIEFSDMMAQRNGWAGYGDKQYVPHVLRYYPYGRIFMPGGGQPIVDVALTQIGNTGGLNYCAWYGYDFRVEWCAIFVSWCADQCGCMDGEILPRMEGVRPYVTWFKERGQWQGRDYEPRPGDIIFLDWEGDGLADHVGIVETCEGGVVHTVEGNSGDKVAQRQYTVGSRPVYGYGTVAY